MRGAVGPGTMDNMDRQLVMAALLFAAAAIRPHAAQWTVVAADDPASGHFEFAAGPMSLVTRFAVQRELRLRPGQQKLIFALQSDLHEKVREVLADIAASRSNQSNSAASRSNRNPHTFSGRLARFGEVRKRIETINRTGDRLLAAVLEPKQYNRLKQLRLQSEGARAFERADFVKQLELTDDQNKAIDQLLKADDDNVDDGPETGRESEQTRSRVRKLEFDVRNVLTEPQRRRWDELKGRPFRFRDRRGRERH